MNLLDALNVANFRTKPKSQLTALERVQVLKAQIKAIRKAWPDSAREASAEARRGRKLANAHAAFMDKHKLVVDNFGHRSKVQHAYISDNEIHSHAFDEAGNAVQVRSKMARSGKISHEFD